LLNNIVKAEVLPIQIGDHDGDGTEDLMIKFNRKSVEDIISNKQEVKITITGFLKNGLKFSGSDIIKILTN
jgi:hypothetical protein